MSVIIDLLKKKNGITTRPAMTGTDQPTLRTQELLAETYLCTSGRRMIGERGQKRHTAASGRRPPFLLSASLIGAAMAAFFILSILLSRADMTSYENLFSGNKLDLFGSSSFRNGIVTLSDDSGPGPDAVAIDIGKSVNLLKKSLIIAVRPKRGEMDLRVVLRDKNHRSYVSDIMRVRGRMKGRQNFFVSGDAPKDSIDIANIRQIRIEVEQRAGGAAGETAVSVERVIVINNK